MDLSLKPCTTIARLGEVQRDRDRLSSLPDELLIRILSLLPTKHVVLMCLLLKKQTGVVLPWISSLDFDDSPISHCLERPNEIQRFPSFVSFVDSVLKSHQSHFLTRFRLRVGGDFVTRYYQGCNPPAGCKEGCFPDLKSTHIYAWISFPLIHSGLRELDLCIHLRGLDRCQLPPEIFMYETLEVLKLDVNLGFDGVSTFRLPNLKMLHLSASFMSEESFLSRLVSSCPLLEDLDVKAWWNNHVHLTSISSPSLRRLSLAISKLQDDDNSDLVIFDTPNLEYLAYDDNVASQYSITSMGSLVEAQIGIQEVLVMESIETSCQRLLTLIKALSNVSHLVLYGSCIEVLNFIERKDQLPVFHNMIYLELGGYASSVWDKVLVAFLHRCPNLETLVFPEGFDVGECCCDGIEELELEQQFCKTTLASIPWCCRFNLKRIVIKYCHGSERQINWIQFLLRHSLVLEELVVFCRQISDEPTLKSTLHKLPRASLTCSIQVQ